MTTPPSNMNVICPMAPLQEMQQALLYYRKRSLAGQPVPIGRMRHVDNLLAQYDKFMAELSS